MQQYFAYGSTTLLLFSLQLAIKSLKKNEREGSKHFAPCSSGSKIRVQPGVLHQTNRWVVNTV
jgi:hypothetical protein